MEPSTSGLDFKLCGRHLEKKMPQIKVLMLRFHGRRQTKGISRGSRLPRWAAVPPKFSRGQY